MPGFFADRQDYGGDVFIDIHWNNLVCPDIENCSPDLNPQQSLYYGFPRGAYDFWSSAIAEQEAAFNAALPVFTYADDPCCCPELACCFPDVVSATITGFKDVTRVPSRSIGLYNCPELFPNRDPKSGRRWYLENSWCSSFIEASIPNHGRSTGTSTECCPDGYTKVRGMFWQNGCYFTDGYKCCSEGSIGFADGPDPRYGNCLSNCDPSSENAGILQNSSTAAFISCESVECPEGTANDWCCTDTPNEVGVCTKPNYIGLCGCNIVDSMNNIVQYDYGDCWTYRDIEWPTNMFPPYGCTDIACCANYQYYSPIPDTQINCVSAPAVGVGEFYAINRSHISKQYLFFDPLTRRDVIENYTWSEICNDTELGLNILCEKPTNTNIIYGPNTYRSSNPDGGQGLQIYDGDHNGTYICHKTVNSFRPELIPQIERSIPLTDKVEANYQAVLIYEVECRRKMAVGAPCQAGAFADSRIVGFQCNKLVPEPTLEQLANGVVPNSKIYCVDYACGPRKIDHVEDDDYPCGEFTCSNDLGSAKPHLTISEYQVSGQDANIDFDIIGIHQDMGYYDAWVTDNFRIISSGTGYSIGDRFIVDFDTSWSLGIQLPNGIWVVRAGQYYPYLFENNILARASQCDQLLGENPNDNPITEKYGLSVDNFVAYPYPWMEPHPVQTIRVSETGVDGRIAKLERVPWFLEREYNENVCSLKDQDEKTPYYPAYSRKLCHPQSVASPGKGYAVGDKIIWKCASEQNCRVWADKYAVAYVVDVDDEGGILDWYINGGDHLNESIAYLEYNQPYGWGYNPITYSYLGGSLGFPCFGSDAPEFTGILVGDEYDDRGFYYYNGTNLCSLNWTGIGVPIRARTNKFVDWEESRIDPCFIEAAISGGVPSQATACGNITTEYNSGYLTQLNLSISRVTAETSVDIIVEKYKYQPKVYLRILELENVNPDANADTFNAILAFPPYPKCMGGGAEIKPIIYQCDDPVNNKTCGNESVFGGSLSGTLILSSGAYYAFINREHVEPILPTGVPDIIGGSGNGAVIDNFVFDKVDNFPHPDVFDNYFYVERWNKNFIIDPDRYAYFPLISVSIANPGSGYEINQEFELYPDNGKPFSSGWASNTADDPKTCPNGGWYVSTDGPPDSLWGYVDPSGRWDIYRQYSHFDYDADGNIRPLQSKAKIKITQVNEIGGITDIAIIHSGMMFRTIETIGITHPDISPYLGSTLGYGAVVNMTIDSDKNSEHFGKVTDVYFTNPVINTFVENGYLLSIENHDPMHSIINLSQPIENSVIVGWSGNATRGYGRDYANPENGYFWMLNNVDIDTGVKLLAYYPFGDSFSGPFSRQYVEPHKSGAFSPLGDLVAYDYVHEEFSTHDIIEGSMPPYVPKSSICSFNDCYHGLLNKTYPLYRQWTGNNDAGLPDTAAPGVCLSPCQQTHHPYGYGNELIYMEDGRPNNNYCVLLKKGKSITYDCLGDGSVNLDGNNTANYAVGNDYIVVEYGFNMQLSHNAIPATGCPDYTDGRTWDGQYTAGYRYQ